MIIQSPQPEAVWMLDRDKQSMERLADVVRERFGRVSFRLFGDPADACSALAEPAASGLPWLIIHDKIGITLPAREPFHARADATTPLTLTYLYSRSAYDDRAQVDRWLSSRLVDAASPKGRVEDLLGTIARWRDNWSRPVAVKVRSYITAHPAPRTPYMRDPVAGSFSLVDVHREIVLGTELGEELAEDWGAVLDDERLDDSRREKVGV